MNPLIKYPFLFEITGQFNQRISNLTIKDISKKKVECLRSTVRFHIFTHREEWANTDRSVQIGKKFA